jgi:hypothetical protein
MNHCRSKAYIGKINLHTFVDDVHGESLTYFDALIKCMPVNENEYTHVLVVVNKIA